MDSAGKQAQRAPRPRAPTLSASPCRGAPRRARCDPTSAPRTLRPSGRTTLVLRRPWARSSPGTADSKPTCPPSSARTALHRARCVPHQPLFHCAAPLGAVFARCAALGRAAHQAQQVPHPRALLPSASPCRVTLHRAPRAFTPAAPSARCLWARHFPTALPSGAQLARRCRVHTLLRRHDAWCDHASTNLRGHLDHPRSRVFHPVASQSYLFILGTVGVQSCQVLTQTNITRGGTQRHAPRRSSRASAWLWRASRRVSSLTSCLGRHSVPHPTALTTHRRMALAGALARIFIHVTPGAAICASPTALITHQRMALAGALARIFIHITPGAALCATPHGAHHAPAHGPGGRTGAYFPHITPGAALCAAPHGAHHAPAHGPGGCAGAYLHSHHAWGGTLCHAPRRSSRTSAWPRQARRRVSSFTSRQGRHSVPRPSALITHQRMALAGAQGVSSFTSRLGRHSVPRPTALITHQRIALTGAFGAYSIYPVAIPY